VQGVGSYNVNPDCSISVSLTDVFGTNTNAAQFVGIVLGRGTEIDLTTVSGLNSQTAVGTSTGTTTGTGTTTTTGTGSSTATGTPSASRLTIKLIRALYRNPCSDTNVVGLYGFVLNPIQIQASTTTGTTGTSTGTGTTTGTTTTQASAVIGYLDFDGAGNIIASTNTANVSPSTTYSALVFTGTYSVNPDCTGTMTISSPAATSSTSTTSGSSSANQTLTIGFVVSAPTFTAQPGIINSNLFSAPPDLNLSFSDSDESGWGYAQPQ
jgi:hypothetical protein